MGYKEKTRLSSETATEFPGISSVVGHTPRASKRRPRREGQKEGERTHNKGERERAEREMQRCADSEQLLSMQWSEQQASR